MLPRELSEAAASSGTSFTCEGQYSRRVSFLFFPPDGLPISMLFYGGYFRGFCVGSKPLARALVCARFTAWYSSYCSANGLETAAVRTSWHAHKCIGSAYEQAGMHRNRNAITFMTCKANGCCRAVAAAAAAIDGKCDGDDIGSTSKPS